MIPTLAAADGVSFSVAGQELVGTWAADEEIGIRRERGDGERRKPDPLG